MSKVTAPIQNIPNLESGLEKTPRCGERVIERRYWTLIGCYPSNLGCCYVGLLVHMKIDRNVYGDQK